MGPRRRRRRGKKRKVNRYRYPYVRRKKRRGPRPIPKEKRKRALTAFQKYSKKERIKIRRQRPNITAHQMTKELSRRWRRLTHSEQMKFLKRRRRINRFSG